MNQLSQLLSSFQKSDVSSSNTNNSTNNNTNTNNNRKSDDEFYEGGIARFLFDCERAIEHLENHSSHQMLRTDSLLRESLRLSERALEKREQVLGLKVDLSSLVSECERIVDLWSVVKSDNDRNDDDDDDEDSIEKMVVEAEVCKRMDLLRADLMKRREEEKSKEDIHKEGVEAVLALKMKLKQEFGLVSNSNSNSNSNRIEEAKEVAVVEEEDVLNASRKFKNDEKSLDEFLNEESPIKDNGAGMRTEYGKVRAEKFERQKQELLEKQRTAYANALLRGGEKKRQQKHGFITTTTVPNNNENSSSSSSVGRGSSSSSSSLLDNIAWFSSSNKINKR
jgi:hypothetical protein